MRLALTALLAVLVTGGASAPSMTVNQLLLEPSRYEDQIVRLRGTIDQCTPVSCHVCARPDSHIETCVNLRTWQGQPDDEQSGGLDERYRFADVILTGRLNYYRPDEEEADNAARARVEEATGSVPVVPRGALWRGSRDKLPAAGAIWLSDVEIEQVTTARPATAGLLLEDYDRTIQPVSETKAALEAYASQAPAAYALVPGREVRVFSPLSGKMPGRADVLWVCQALAGRVDRWPTRVGELLRSPANPYRCFGGWLDPDRNPKFYFGAAI